MGKSKKKATKRDSPIDNFEVIDSLPVEQSVSFLVPFCFFAFFLSNKIIKNLMMNFCFCGESQERKVEKFLAQNEAFIHPRQTFVDVNIFYNWVCRIFKSSRLLIKQFSTLVNTNYFLMKKHVFNISFLIWYSTWQNFSRRSGPLHLISEQH